MVQVTKTTQIHVKTSAILYKLAESQIQQYFMPDWEKHSLKLYKLIRIF